ncbi:MAG: DUF1833 family protein [Spirochaetaceae bacterium]|nr:DUF1833 family protein [Spirochaetaceae bacterium]
MSRAISSTARAALYAQEAGFALPVLLEITHGVAGVANPLRIANNETDLTFGGQTYLAFPFRFDPPDQREDGSIQNARLTICAVDQQIAAVLRSTQSPPSVRAVATFWSDEGGMVFEQVAAWDMTLRNVSGNAEQITADLIYEERLDNEAPADEFRPTTFPGVF